MKKIILIVLMLAFCLMGCQSNEFKKLGYSDEEIELIEKLSEDSQMFFRTKYDENYIKILKNSFFEENNLDLYIKYYGQLDDDTLIKVINEGNIRKYGFDVVEGIYTDPYYIEDHKQQYFDLHESFDNYRDLVEYVNVQRYDEYYTNTNKTNMDKELLIIVNKYNYLESDYYPDDLIEVHPAYGRGWMREVIYDDFVRMIDDAYADGYDIISVSPFRSYDTQYNLYNGYLEDDPQEVVDTYSARPGFSEHQTGLAVDISTPGVSLDDFVKTDAHEWIKNNCHKYGFIVRYPEGKDDITGYQYEPWHLRYLGEIAEDVYNSGLTYDEYYEYYIK